MALIKSLLAPIRRVAHFPLFQFAATVAVILWLQAADSNSVFGEIFSALDWLVDFSVKQFAALFEVKSFTRSWLTVGFMIVYVYLAGWVILFLAKVVIRAADARNLAIATSIDWFKQGDAEAELAKAATVVEAEYRCRYAYHAQMEPLNAVAAVSAAGDSAEVWCGTQYPTAALAAAARALNIPAEKVRLNYTLLGGGFGRRGDYDQEFVVDAVLMAKSAQRPVKVMWTREDDVHNGHFRPITAHYLRAGLDASGKLVAWHQRVVGDRVLPFEDPPRFHANHDRDYLLMNGVELKSYDIPNQYGGQIGKAVEMLGKFSLDRRLLGA